MKKIIAFFAIFVSVCFHSSALTHWVTTKYKALRKYDGYRLFQIETEPEYIKGVNDAPVINEFANSNDTLHMDETLVCFETNNPF